MEDPDSAARLQFADLLGWKTLPNRSNASTRVVYCIDSQSGEILWERQVKNIPGSPGGVQVSGDTGYAASTMATDGVRIFASFANGDLAAFDLEGSPVWSKNLGKPENLYGHASSLVTHGDNLLIQYDQENLGYVAALDVATDINCDPIPCR